MKKRSAFTRLLSLVLCLAMVMPWLPTGIWAVGSTTEVYSAAADPHTLDQWKQFFGPDENGDLSTEFAGGVWTDKSVFAPGAVLPEELTNARYHDTGITFENRGDNFLVTLSAMAANKEIIGYSTIPTDTVLVLDLSSSMRSKDENGESAVDELATATNSAIAELLELNKNNRVAVVAYAGNTHGDFANDYPGNATVLLPLDTYTANNGKFIEAVNSRGNSIGDDLDSAYGLRVARDVKNAQGQSVSRTSMLTNAGTWTQNGIFEALEVLLRAEPTVSTGIQAGTDRIPIFVLMTDGEPTMTDEGYYGNYSDSYQTTDDLAIDNAFMVSYSNTLGDGGYTHRQTMAFVTSLTAAFAKKAAAKHYGSEPLFYTLVYGNIVDSRTETLGVVDPVHAPAEQLAMWEQFVAGKEVVVYKHGSGELRYTSNVEDTNDVRHLDAEDRLYVDKYFRANTNAAMENAFDSIVAEIELQSRYYPTYMDGHDYNHDGYLTFTDKIGDYMDVSGIKGIVIGDRLFSGAALAKAFLSNDFGTVEEPTTLGDELVRSLKARLNISSVAEARTLIDNAFNYGQFSYTSDTQYSHYLGWFSDPSGNYIDFWHEDMTQEQIEQAQAKGATHIVKSYGFVGAANSTDMLYMSVKVSRPIGGGDTILTWKIPASLVPIITYHVEVPVDESTGAVGDATSVTIGTDSAQTPIRLVYEVALREDIQDWNIAEKVPASYVASQDNKQQGYSFYTNKWMSEANDVSVDGIYGNDTTRNTYSHFEPSRENERYYCATDTTIYVDGAGGKTAYTSGSTAPKDAGSTTFYRLYHVYIMQGGTCATKAVYEQITAQSLEKAEKRTDNTWYIPKGTVLRLIDSVNMVKADNQTGTMAYSDNPFIISDGDAYYTYSTQGNNGLLTVTPATGIKLTKTLTARVTGAADRFEFTVAANGGAASLANAQVVRLDAEGNEAERTALGADGKLTLAANETVYIIGLTPGQYTVTESKHTDYILSVISGGTVSGNTTTVTVAEQTIQPLQFVNAPKGYGSLVLGKDVIYENGINPNANHNAREFAISVTFAGDQTDLDKITVAATEDPSHDVLHYNNKVEGDGYVTYTLHLRDNDTVTFSQIAEGITYEVTENGLVESPTVTNPLPYGGYRNTAITYYAPLAADEEQLLAEEHVILANNTHHVQVVNAYAPAAVTPNITVSGTKTVYDTWSAEGPLANKTFQVKLLQVKDMGSEPELIATETVTRTDPEYAFTLTDSLLKYPFDKVGMYYFRIVEHIPAAGDEDFISNMGYDESVGLFTVEIGDANADGQLEIVAVTATSSGVTVTTPGTAGGSYVVDKDFVNHKEADMVYIPVQKHIETVAAPNGLYANLRFGLFTGTDAESSTYSAITDASGLATIAFAVTETMVAEAGGQLIYYLREIAPALENRDVGMTYNTAWQYAIRITWGHGAAVVQYAAYQESGNYTDWTTIDPAAAVPQLSITNEYDPDVVSTPDIELSGDKVLSRPDGSDKTGIFGFEVYQTGADFVVAQNQQPIQSVSSAEMVGNTGRITFAPITFRAPGTYYLVIQETGRGTTVGGVTYDSSKYSVVVQVEKYADPTTGKTLLRVVSGYPLIQRIGSTTPLAPDALDFTNTYTIPGTGSATISGIKELSGKNLFNGEFSFVLTEVQPAGSDYQDVAGGWTETVSNGPSADGKTAAFAFTPITYDSTDLGDHYYRIAELNRGQDGVEYDSDYFIVKVTVRDNGDGTLTVSQPQIVFGGSTILFENTYTPDPVSTQLTVFKELRHESGEVMSLLGRTFRFTVVETEQDFVTPVPNGLNQQLTVDHTGQVNTGSITFTAEGSRYFVIKEVVPDQAVNNVLDGVTYDPAEFHVTVTCTNDLAQGKLVLTSRVQEVRPDPGATGGTITVAAGSVSFDNTYGSTDAELIISGNKNLVGDSLGNRVFGFELYKTGEDYSITDPAIQTKHNLADGSFAFDALTFDAVGQYHYVVKEAAPADDDAATPGIQKDGVTYDPKVYKLLVTVTDDGKGALVATYEVVGATDHNIIFRNVYQVDGSASVTINGNKTFTGSGVANPTFTFDLFETGADYAVQAGAVPAETLTKPAGAFSFVLQYTGDMLDAQHTSKVFYYVLRERNTGLAYIDYDEDIYKLKVTLSHDGSGSLTVQVTEAAGLTAPDAAATAVTVSGADFQNRYQFTAGGSATISGSKELTGKDLADGEFRFTLTEMQQKAEGGYQVLPNGLTETVSNAGAAFAFSSILYTGENLGDHYYRVTEAQGTNDLMAYDQTEYIVKITVTDNGDGTITVSDPVVVSGDSDKDQRVDHAMVFRNVYTPASVSETLTVEKILLDENGLPMAFGNRVFQFTIQETAGDFRTVIPGGFHQVVDPAAASNEITFGWDHEVGEYSRYFVIREVIPAGAVNNVYQGVTYDTTEYHVTIKCTNDEENGVLKLDKTVVKAFDTDPATLSFTNHYTTADGNLTIQGTKVLENATLTAGQFSFRLYESDEHWTEGSPVGSPVWNRADGAFDLPKLTYDDSHIGTHYYLVKEVDGDGLKHDDGITYDDAVFKIKVTVSDNGKGAIVAAYTLEDTGDSSVRFTNTYSVEGEASVTIGGGKELTGTGTTGHSFTFQLFETDSSYDITGLTAKDTQEKAPGQQFGFNLKYTTADLGADLADKVFYYVVRELDTGLDYIDYDETQYRIQVTVSHERGKLITRVEAPGLTVSGSGTNGAAVSGADFANTYNLADGNVVIQGQKWLDGRVPADGQFHFRLFHSSAQWDLGTQIGQAVANDASGKFAFPAITYDGTQLGDHYYLVKEVDGGSRIDGITHDPKVYGIKVTVRDNGSGQIETGYQVYIGAEEQTNGAVFNNTYSVTGGVTVTINGLKELTGTLVANPSFTFQLFETGSDYQTDGLTAKDSDTKGKGAFGFVLHYTKDDLGPDLADRVYYYVIREKATGLSYITDDAREYRIKVTLSHEKGELTAAVEAPGLTVNTNQAKNDITVTGVTFTNRYTMTPDKIQIGGKKELDNAILTADQFSFQLFESDQDWAEVRKLGTVKNKADGSFLFPEISYDKDHLGTHYYLVKEEGGGGKQDGIAYDPVVYKITVTAVDNGLGRVVATYKVDGTEGKQITFNNTYSVEGNVSVIIQGSKELTGTQVGNPSFTFELFRTGGDHAITGAPIQTVTQPKGGFRFRLDYKVEDLGENLSNGVYYYVLREKNTGLSYIGYDETLYKLKVTLSHSKGVLVATVEADGLTVTPNGANTQITLSGADFSNTYKLSPDSVEIQGSKELVGSGLKADQFRFDLYETGADYATAGSSPIKTQGNAPDGSFGFKLDYTAAGEHYYVLRESAANAIPGILYDETVYTFKVTVADDGQGSLVAKLECTSGQSKVTFRNVPYEEITHKDVAQSKEPQITIDGKPVKLGDRLTYTITYTNYNGRTETVTFRDTLPDGTVFISADQGGKLKDGQVTWTLEVKPEETVAVKLTVEVALSGVAVENDAIVIDSRNEYTTNSVSNEVPKIQDVTIDITVDKKLNMVGAQVKGPDGFTFQLEDVAADKKLTGKTVNGKLTFPLTFTEADIGKTFTYKLREVNEGIANMTYDTTVYTYTVTVTTDGSKLILDLTADGKPVQTLAGTFTNIYDVEPAAYILAARKFYDGKTMKEFTFLLSGEGIKTQEKTNDAQGNILFDTLLFYRAGTYEFKVTEKDTLHDYVVYDKTVYTVKLTVVDNGQGKLVLRDVQVNDKLDQSLTFHNGYLLQAGTVQILGQKTLVGGPLVADAFRFDLYETGADYSLEGLEPIKTLGNGQDGSIVFNGANVPELTYTAEGVHYYVLAESTADPVAGVTYDDTVYTFKVTVTDDQEGKLVAVLECTSGQEKVTFRNIYEDPNQKTGDLANPALLLGMMLASTMGLVVLLPAKKRIAG